MATTYNRAITQFDLHAFASLDEVGSRFEQGFQSLLTQKKLDAVLHLLNADCAGWQVVKNPAFIQQVVYAVNDEALQEQPYTFISLNTQQAFSR